MWGVIRPRNGFSYPGPLHPSGDGPVSIFVCIVYLSICLYVSVTCLCMSASNTHTNTHTHSLSLYLSLSLSLCVCVCVCVTGRDKAGPLCNVKGAGVTCSHRLITSMLDT